MKKPPSASNAPTSPIIARSWSESLKNQTREAVEECRINPATQKLHMKNTNGKCGHITFQDLLAGRLIVCNSNNFEECFTAENVEDLLAAGWVID